MKKLLLFLFIILTCLNGFSQSLFVKTRICPILEHPNNSSLKITNLKQNDQVQVLDIENDWIKLQTKNITGYAKRVFFSDKVTVQCDYSNGIQIASIEIRKRASNFTSSAAAGRGLAKENVRDRNNVSFKDYDFNSIKWITENFKYSDDELIDFWESEIK